MVAFRCSGRGTSVSARQASNCCLNSPAISTGTPSHSPVKHACTSFACVMTGVSSALSLPASDPAPSLPASEFSPSPSAAPSAPASEFFAPSARPSIFSRMAFKSSSDTVTYCDLYFRSPSAFSASSRNSSADTFSSPMAISQSKSSKSFAVNAPKLMLPCRRILGLGLPTFSRFFGISVLTPKISSFLRQSCRNSSNTAPCIMMGEAARFSMYVPIGLNESAMPFRIFRIERRRASFSSNRVESGVSLSESKTKTSSATCSPVS